MCVIALCNTRRINKPEFFEAFRCNKDGAGMAWREEDKMRYVKGIMKDKDAWACYNDLIKENNFPHVVHFRVGSPVIPELTHPFIISKDSELFLNYEGNQSLLFHNGIVSNWKSLLLPIFIVNKIIPEGEFSDTRMVAILINDLGEKVLEFVDGKYAIFDQEKLKYFGSWEEESEGIVWSNKSYKLTSHNNHYNQGNMYGYGGYNYTNWKSGSVWDADIQEWVVEQKEEKPSSVLDYGSYETLESIGSSKEFVV
jgi:hypothetical protein